MRHVFFGVTLLGAMLAMTLMFSARAETPEPCGRYQLVKTNSDFAWRLDRQTGEVSVCRFDGAAMFCGSSNKAITRDTKSYRQYLDEERAERQAEREETLSYMARLTEFFRASILPLFRDVQDMAEEGS